ncbi:MAG: flagellar motor protein PomA [OM182 bacterium]|jgi:chemotaxis protein MotA|nr:MAG: flagellar motor protein PomA [OM182 bacterium]HBK18122.1 flagellar motor protein PomA [Gammaproteobacteria bacterium]
MDIATVVGLIAALALIVIAMIGAAGLDAFVDVSSVQIVFGGSLGVLLMRSKMGDFIGMFSKTIMKTIMAGVDKPADLIEQIIEMANIARKDGLIALEGQEIKNSYLAKGIGLLVDGAAPDIIESSLENELALMKSRHATAALQWRSWCDIAPAMGMIGTLVGLVGMLQNMSDPKAIGPAMAIALLTTLYGAFLANVICKPIAEKLEQYSKDESENCELIIEGLMGIQAGTNPRSLSDLLATRVAPGDRAALEAA